VALLGHVPPFLLLKLRLEFVGIIT